MLSTKVFAKAFSLLFWMSLTTDAIAQPAVITASRYSFPVQNFVGYSRYFGWQDASKKQFNDGIDILASKGSYVHAWSRGTIKDISYNPQCGWRMTITYLDWSTDYCGIGGGVTVDVGQDVQAGDVVAKLDDQSTNGKAVLHWSLRYKGNLVNPYEVIRMMQLSRK
jgi:murein DD-endopeptidase MepM/ murein hydrolase activator NlpD